MPIEAAAKLMPIHDVEPIVESPFYIPMTGPAARPRRALKHDDTFVVLDSHGDIGASAGGPDGLFNTDTRYLARLELSLDGLQPLLLGSNLRDDNSALTVDLTNPDTELAELTQALKQPGIKLGVKKSYGQTFSRRIFSRATAAAHAGRQSCRARPARCA